MRFVLCDDDELFTTMIGAMLADRGHEVVGVAATTAASVALIEAARPHVVIVDLSLGINTDFDVVTAAAGVGASVIAFTQNADDVMLGQYTVRPTVVFKPDLPGLERVVERLAVDNQQRVVEHDQRQRPGRAAAGPVPTSLGDAQAFYEALNEASAGDALVSIEVPAHERWHGDALDTATRVSTVMRETDRLLASTSMLRVYLPVGDDVGVASFRARLDAVEALPSGAIIRSIVIGPGESPADAYERLRSAGSDPS